MIGADHKLVDERGCTFLHASANANHLALYKRFLDLGVDSNLRKADGQTAIDVSLSDDHSESLAERCSDRYGEDASEMICLC